MANGSIGVQITIDDQGNCHAPLLPVPNSNGGSQATVIIWTITGGTFQTSPPGIQLKTPIIGPPYDPPFVAGPPNGFARQYVLQDLNNSAATAGSFGYTVNYVFNGENKSLDPTIDNQPPPTDDDDQ